MLYSGVPLSHPYNPDPLDSAENNKEKKEDQETTKTQLSSLPESSSAKHKMDDMSAVETMETCGNVEHVDTEVVEKDLECPGSTSRDDQPKELQNVDAEMKLQRQAGKDDHPNEICGSTPMQTAEEENTKSMDGAPDFSIGDRTPSRSDAFEEEKKKASMCCKGVQAATASVEMFAANVKAIVPPSPPPLPSAPFFTASSRHEDPEVGGAEVQWWVPSINSGLSSATTQRQHQEAPVVRHIPLQREEPVPYNRSVASHSWVGESPKKPAELTGSKSPLVSSSSKDLLHQATAEVSSAVAAMSSSAAAAGGLPSSMVPPRRYSSTSFEGSNEDSGVPSGPSSGVLYHHSPAQHYPPTPLNTPGASPGQVHARSGSTASTSTPSKPPHPNFSNIPPPVPSSGSSGGAGIRLPRPLSGSLRSPREVLSGTSTPAGATAAGPSTGVVFSSMVSPLPLHNLPAGPSFSPSNASSITSSHPTHPNGHPYQIQNSPVPPNGGFMTNFTPSLPQASGGGSPRMNTPNRSDTDNSDKAKNETGSAEETESPLMAHRHPSPSSSPLDPAAASDGSHLYLQHRSAHHLVQQPNSASCAGPHMYSTTICVQSTTSLHGEGSLSLNGNDSAPSTGRRHTTATSSVHRPPPSPARCPSPNILASFNSIPHPPSLHCPTPRANGSRCSSTRSTSQDRFGSRGGRVSPRPEYSRDTVWVSLQDVSGPPYVPTHLEHHRRATPRRLSEYDYDDIGPNKPPTPTTIAGRSLTALGMPPTPRHHHQPSSSSLGSSVGGTGTGAGTLPAAGLAATATATAAASSATATTNAVSGSAPPAIIPPPPPPRHAPHHHPHHHHPSSGLSLCTNHSSQDDKSSVEARTLQTTTGGDELELLLSSSSSSCSSSSFASCSIHSSHEGVGEDAAGSLVASPSSRGDDDHVVREEGGEGKASAVWRQCEAKDNASDVSAPSPEIRADPQEGGLEEEKEKGKGLTAPCVVLTDPPTAVLTSSTMMSLVAGTPASRCSTVAGTASTSTGASSSTVDLSMEVLKEAVERAKRRQAAAEN